MENEQIQTEEQIDYSSVDQQKDIETASRSLKAMSHPLRLMILCKLGEDEFSVQDIVDNVGTSQSNISQHLAILRDKGILSARKDANKVFYKVTDFKTLKLIDMMREVFCPKHHAPGHGAIACDLFAAAQCDLSLHLFPFSS